MSRILAYAQVLGVHGPSVSLTMVLVHPNTILAGKASPTGLADRRIL